MLYEDSIGYNWGWRKGPSPYREWGSTVLVQITWMAKGIPEETRLHVLYIEDISYAAVFD
jgi:hypothetical protein